MAQVTITLHGLDKIRLAKLARALGNMQQPLGLAMRYLRRQVEQDTRKGKKVGGGRYAPYRPSYAEWLARKGLLGAKDWLALTGAMYRGMGTRVGRTQAQIGYWGKNKAETVANVHHEGRRGHTAARPWFAWRRGYVRHVTGRIIWPWIGTEVERAGVRFTVGF
jgi:hypothetical protein